jgi:4-hydroxy-3-methylbut-2-en-1-yl diphosphate reductase
MQRPCLTILLAEPRGFCAGVQRAVEIVEKALAKYGAPVYVRREIVHNRHVVAGLEGRGAVFIEELDQAPDDRPVVLSAHGVPKAVPAEAARRNLTLLDATCPLVSKVHHEAEQHFARGRQIILIGHAGHPEVIGTMGQLPPGAILLVDSAAAAEAIRPQQPDRLAYVTQTTLAIDDTAGIVAILERRFPGIEGPRRDDICYATTNRQQAVTAIARRAEALLVVGAANSSNSTRLVEVAKRAGCPRSFLIDSARAVDWPGLAAIRRLGLTAGASVPEWLVEEVLAEARRRYTVAIEAVRVTSEDVVFRLPRAIAS